jgi:hypothetical protein
MLKCSRSVNKRTEKGLCTPHDVAVDKIKDCSLPLLPNKEHPFALTLPDHPPQFPSIITDHVEIVYRVKISEEIPRCCFQAILLHFP